MPQIILNLSANHAQRLVDAYCGIYQYQEHIPSEGGTLIPNPESRSDFAKRMISGDIKNSIRSWEHNRDISTAVKSIVTTDIDIT